MSDSEGEAQDLNDIANFIILITTGALIPLFLVIYKSRCSSICWGCIKRKVVGQDDSDEETTKLKELPAQSQPQHLQSVTSPRPSLESQPEAEAKIQV